MNQSDLVSKSDLESGVDRLLVEVKVPEEEGDGEHGPAQRGLGARQLRVGLVGLVRAPVHLHLLVVLEEAVADQREVLQDKTKLCRKLVN